MFSVPQNIQRTSQRDLAAFRHSRGRAFRRLVLYPSLAFLAVALLVIGFSTRDFTAEQYQYELTQLEASSHSRAASFAAQQRGMAQWLLRHGTKSEFRIFRGVSYRLLTMGNDLSVDHEDSSLSFWFLLYGGISRVVFLVISSWRLWLLVVIASLFWGLRSLRPFAGPDLLGETGVGQLFYSGMYVGLGNVTDSGAPDKLVPGLACPPRCSPTVTRHSRLAKVLEQFDAQCATNRTLAAIVLEHHAWPAYAPIRAQKERFSSTFTSNALPEGTELLLEALLQLHAHYRSCEFLDEEVEVHSESSGDQAQSEGTISSVEQYVLQLAQAANTVLSPAWRQELAELSAKVLAALVLALQAGKTLAYRREGGSWEQVSPFPQLSARAVLHSVAELDDDFSFSERQLLRQAIIYSTRQSVFGPVRFPAEIDDKTLALRAWAELLETSPLDFGNRTHEIELFNLVRELHRDFETRFFQFVSEQNNKEALPLLTDERALFFAPVQVILKIFRETSAAQQRARLGWLVSTVGKGLRVKEISEQSGEEKELSTSPCYSRLLPPLPSSELPSLAKKHDLSVDDLRDWSALRTVLHSFSWLAKRVGDYTVPEAMVFTLTYVDGAGDVPQKAPAMAAFRTSRLQEHWRTNWTQYFAAVREPNIAPEERAQAISADDDPVQQMLQEGEGN